MEINLVEIWLRKDPPRWIAGALSGIFAGLVMFAFAMLLSAMTGHESWLPVKIAAIPILGARATELGFRMDAILTGLIFFEVLATILGVAYAHFTGTNFLPALLGMGFVWGAFSWIFIHNLFMQSVNQINYMDVSRGGGLVAWLVFGVSLTSVAFFDRMVRGGKPIAPVTS